LVFEASHAGLLGLVMCHQVMAHFRRKPVSNVLDHFGEGADRMAE